MRTLRRIALCAAVLCAAGCRKNSDMPHVPSIPSVVLAGERFSQDETGGLTESGAFAQGAPVLAYLSADADAPYSAAEVLRGADIGGGETADLVHVFSPDGGTDCWAREGLVVLNASPVVLLEERPIVGALSDDPAQFSDADAAVPAHTIVAAHHNGMMLDYLQISWLDGGELRTGFIENPHPSFSTGVSDAQAVRLYQETCALAEGEKAAKKSLLDRALALDGLSPSVRRLVQDARTALDPPPPRPMTAQVRLRAPDLRTVRTGSRYGVNMGELLSGGTEDPWAKGN